MAEPPRTARILVLADDLDVLLGGFGADYRTEAIDLVARLAREGPSRGIDLAASSQSMATMHALAGSFGSRLLLRLGEPGGARARGRRGRALRSGRPAGIGNVARIGGPGGHRRRARCQPTAVDGRVPALPEVTFAPGSLTAIVSGRPRELRAGLLAAGVRLIDVGIEAGRWRDGSRRRPSCEVTSGDAPIVVLGDPDAWNAEWALLGRARREWPIVLHAATLADHRALTRSRELPPPLGARPGECWLVRDGVTVRAILPGPSLRGAQRIAARRERRRAPRSRGRAPRPPAG